jgi:hypothetical protein
MSVKKEFNLIFKRFNEHGNYSATSIMIIAWIQKYKDEIQSKDNIEDILLRLNDTTQEVQDIIDDFLYGDLYKTLRNEFSRK